MRKCMEHFADLLASEDTCIYVQTYEENEFIQDLAEILVPSEINAKEQEDAKQGAKSKKQDAVIYVYSRFEGLYRIDPYNPEDYSRRRYEKDVKNVNQLLKFIEAKSNNVSAMNDSFDIAMLCDTVEDKTEDEVDPPTVFILKDMHLFFDKDTIRAFRDIKENLFEEKYCPIIVTSPVVDIPTELEKLFTYFEYEQMTKQDIKDFLYSNAIEGYTEEEIDAICTACVGLTRREIIRSMRHSKAMKNEINTDIIHNEKIQIVKKTGALNYLEPRQTLEDTGGYDSLKTWVRELKVSMTPEAKAFGVAQPKGAMLVGLPGNGKTMTSEIIANYLHIPLLQLDLAKIMGSFVGQSERAIANALRIVKACAPCVLLIDEAEKVLGGSVSSNATDSGTLSRVVAQILNFLQEDDTGVITIMTSNNVFELPPELTRSGRLDAQWYFGFPNLEERKEILDIYLKKNQLTVSDNIYNFIVRNTKNYSGAEIKEIVKNLLIKSYFRQLQEGKEPQREVTVEDVKGAISSIVPIYQSSKEKIDMFTEMVKGRYRNASGESEAA